MESNVEQQFQAAATGNEEELSVENIMNAVKRMEMKGAGARISDSAWAES